MQIPAVEIVSLNNIRMNRSVLQIHFPALVSTTLKAAAAGQEDALRQRLQRRRLQVLAVEQMCDLRSRQICVQTGITSFFFNAGRLSVKRVCLLSMKMIPAQYNSKATLCRKE